MYQISYKSFVVFLLQNLANSTKKNNKKGPPIWWLFDMAK